MICELILDFAKVCEIITFTWVITIWWNKKTASKCDKNEDFIQPESSMNDEPESLMNEEKSKLMFYLLRGKNNIGNL